MSEPEAEVAAVFGGARFDQIGQAVHRREDAGVVGEQAEHEPHQQHFERVALVAILFQQVVQFAELFDRIKVDRVLFADHLLLVAGDEAEALHVAVQILQRKFGVVVRFAAVEVVQTETREVGHEDVLRQVGVFQPVEVFSRLLVRGIELRAPALVLDQQFAFPQQIDVTVLAVNLLDLVFEACHTAALDAEDFKELVPERLRFRVLGFGVLPITRERERIGLDVVP